MKRKRIPTSSSFGAEFGYSRAVRVDRHVHVAGTCAQPPHDQGDAYEQAKDALEIIAKALDETGARPRRRGADGRVHHGCGPC